MQVPVEPPDALAYFNKIAASKLSEYGFALATEGCEVTVQYTHLAAFQGEEVRYGPLGTTARSGYWSEEGIARVSHDGQVVNLRGYSSRLHVLEGLASVLVKSVVRRFRPSKDAGR
jgi:hypothetical protein